MSDRLMDYQYAATTSRRKLWQEWTIATTLGEWVGFAIPALVGALVAGLQMPDGAQLTLLPVAGMAEGACVAFAQSLVLRRLLSDFPQGFPQRHWIVSTAIAAGISWLIGQLPSHLPNALENLTQTSPLLMAGLDIVLGLALVCSIGIAQWVVLRRFFRWAIWWIPANAIAWTMGVMMPVLGLMLMPDRTPMLARFGVALVCGALMGLIVAVCTGVVLVWLPRRQPR